MRFLSVFLLLVFLTGGVCKAAFGEELMSYGFGTSRMIRDNTRDRVYCAVPARNSVAVIDSQSLQVVATVFTGSLPNSLAQSPDGSLLYVANMGTTEQGLTVLDLETLTIVRSIATTHPVTDVAVGNGTVYTVEDDSLRAYNTSDGTARAGRLFAYQGGVSVYSGTLGLSLDSNTLYYYQSGLSPSSWYRIDVSSWPGVSVQSGKFGSNGQGFALSADGQWITFVSGAPYYVNKFRASNPTVSVGQFNTGAYPRFAAYSPNGNTLFTTHTNDRIDVWNANTYVELPPIATTGQPARLLCERQGKVLFAGTDNTLKAYYIGTGTSSSLNVQINTAVEIRWESVSGYLYQIEWKSLITGTEWFSLGGPILGNGLTMSVFDTTRGSRAKFYQVRQVSPSQGLAKGGRKGAGGVNLQRGR